MAGSLASINIRFAVDLEGLSTQMQNVARTIQSVAPKLQAVGQALTLGLTAPIVAAGAAAIKYGSDFQESQNKVDVAFKDSADRVNQFAKTTLESFGIAEGSALDMASLFGDMATSMGLPTEQAAKMATSLVGLAGDLASFKNIGIDQATTALNGVFTGETESLKMLGIVMTEANLAQFALSQGIQKSIKNFTQAEKVQLRYAYVMQQTTNAQGDFERTGSGAANQMRVFQESLKEVAAQFGQVILPAFTAVIKSVNGFIGKIREIDPDMQKVIVVMAGFAAAVGPIVLGLGTAITAFGNASTAIKAFSATLVANPFTAAAVALGAIATAVVVADSRFRSLTNVQKELASVTATAASSISTERVELDRNLSVARNEKRSKEDRLAAIKNLNAISPEYLGNLTLENVNTEKIKNSTDQYVASLLKKATAQAAYNKLIEVQGKLDSLNIKSEEVKASFLQNLTSAALSGGNSVGFLAEQTKNAAANFGEERQALLKLQQELTATIEKNGGLTASNAAVTAGVEKLNIAMGTGAKSGTIKFYKDQISSLEKLQNEFATTPAAIAVLEDRIVSLKTKIDRLEGKRVVIQTVFQQVGEPPAPTSNGTVQEYDTQIADLVKLQDQVATTSQAYSDFEYAVQSLTLEKEITFDLPTDTGLSKATEGVQVFGQKFKVVQGEFQAGLSQMAVDMLHVSGAAADAFGAMGKNIVSSFGLAETGLQGFVKTFLSGVIEIISASLAQSMAQAIAGGTAAGASTGPGAPVAIPTFVASLIGVILGAFASIPKFETGGIIGGSSFYGDRLLARVNSGEMILNTDQQRRMYDMIEPAASDRGVAAQIIGEFKLRGSDLELALARVAKTKKRTE